MEKLRLLDQTPVARSLRLDLERERTTFSGYAFSFRHDYESDPTKIQTNQWIGGGHISLKAPTSVLFTSCKVFHSFGYEAEDKYTELAEEDEHKDWFYFRRFKMMLHNNKVLSRKTLLYDEHKKPMEALAVFSASIKYLRTHLIDSIKKRVDQLDADGDIHWVLTLPAIWNDSAKQFMRLAATTAGISGDHLSLALEPEAASFWCKTLPVERLSSAGSFDMFKTGTCYIVLDLGGGTVDITVHQVQGDGSLSEIAKASGGAWGGTRVDQEFIDLLVNIVGEDVFDSYKEEFTSDYLDLMRELEVKKRSITSDKSGMITVRIPASFCSHYKHKKKTTITDRVEKMPAYRGKIAFKRDKVQIDAEISKGFFDKAIKTTISRVKEIFRGNDFRYISTMLLVGGFAESDIIQRSIKTSFPGKRIIIPNETGLVVLKGAVLFGHNPKIIRSRISKYTYGVEVWHQFIKGKHPECYKVFDDGYYCRYVFEPFVRAGEEMSVDSVVRKNFTSASLDVTEGVGIYASTNPDPMFCTDTTCFKLGVIILEEAGHSNLYEMQFGGTEFTLQITDLDTGVKKVNCFDFLSHEI